MEEAFKRVRYLSCAALRKSCAALRKSCAALRKSCAALRKNVPDQANNDFALKKFIASNEEQKQ